MNEEKFQDEKRDAELMKKASTEIKISYLKMILLLNELTSSQTIVLLNILFEERKNEKS
mgnify:CR=1 FL=1|jgi:hypothetical protein